MSVTTNQIVPFPSTGRELLIGQWLTMSTAVYRHVYRAIFVRFQRTQLLFDFGRSCVHWPTASRLSANQMRPFPPNGNTFYSLPAKFRIVPEFVLSLFKVAFVKFRHKFRFQQFGLGQLDFTILDAILTVLEDSHFRFQIRNTDQPVLLALVNNYRDPITRVELLWSDFESAASAVLNRFLTWPWPFTRLTRLFAILRGGCEYNIRSPKNALDFLESISSLIGPTFLTF